MTKTPYPAHDGRMKKIIQHPRREHWLVRQVLDKLRLRYWEQVRIWNPHFTGLRTRIEGGYQWLEFLVRRKARLFVIIFKPTYGGSRPHKFELRALEEKKVFLEERHIPYLILPRTHSLQEYEIRVELWIRKETQHDQ